MGNSKASSGVMGLCAMMMGMMLMAGGVVGQGPAAAPTTADCTSVVLQLSDCLPYVMANDSTPPTASCCSNLSSIITTNAPCLCQLYNATFTDAFGINVTRAMMLPPACKLSTPDPSLCAIIGIPVPGPAGAPMSPAGSAMAPSSVPTPSGTSPETAPMTPPSTPMATPSPEMQSNSSTTTPPGPSSAPSLVTGSVAVAASLLFSLLLIFH